MTVYDSGSARASYILDISQPRQAAAELRALFQGIQQQSAALAKVSPAAGGSSGATQAADQQKAERAILSRAAAEARLAQVQNTGKNALAGLSQAEQIYQQALAKVDQTSIAALRTRSQLAAVQNRIANQAGGGLPVLPRTVESFGTQAIDQFKSGLLGIVGPAALATAGIAALTGTVESFKQAFVFKAELDAQNAAIRTNLEGVRDSGRVFQEAAAFGDRYRITQKETSDILASSTDILRVSSSSVGDLESALLRLQSRDVSKPISEAARALRELNSGDVTSIKELFNVSAAEALRMKKEIEGGGDAVQVLNGYLERAGVSMEVLENRSKGAAGALNEQKIAAEELAIAQGNIASSRGGIALVQEQATVYRGLANILNGDLIGGLKAQAAIVGASVAGQQAYNQAIARGATETQAAAAQQVAYDQVLRAAYIDLGLFTPAQDAATAATNNHTRALGESKDALDKEALKKLDNQIATAQLSSQQKQLEADSLRAANGLLGAGDQALILARKYGIATEQAQFLINAQQALSNATALADQRKGEQTGTDLTAKQFDAFDKLADQGRTEAAAERKRAADKAAAEAKQLRSAQDALNLARARTKEQKIAELVRQQAATTDPVEKLHLQAQIEQERRAGAGRVGAAQTTALQLNNVEENSQLQLARTQREGLERLRDQQEDFDVRKARSQEDEDRKIRGLLARGQRGAAAREREDFAREQQRAREDFDRERRRTLRNNAEGVGDIGDRTDLRTQQIGARAALRGVTTAGANLPPASLSGSAAAAASAQAAPRVLTVQIAPTAVQIDGHQIVTLTWPETRVLVDDELSAALLGVGTPGSGQTAVAGL